jgi:hypothetical protein
MLLLTNNKVSHTLDSYLDIDKFLSLKDEFYFLFAKNLQRTKDVWNSGGIPADLNWPYLNKDPLLYHTVHSIDDPKVSEFGDDKQGLAKYLQLKYGSFNPYKILHLNEYQKPLYDWVTPAIQTWVDTLPFDSVDVVSFFYNDHYCPLKYHRDYNYFPVEQGDNRNVPDTVQDLIWFRFDLTRAFNLYNIDNFGNILNTYPVEGYSATFNHYNWHGNTESSNRASLTIKVEGKFAQEFKHRIYE